MDKDRINFDQKIEQLNCDFFNKLTNICDNLTIGEKRLSAMLRLNLSSKEIASILNISPSSVDMGRHRLRKKLGINTEENINDFFDKL